MSLLTDMIFVCFICTVESHLLTSSSQGGCGPNELRPLGRSRGENTRTPVERTRPPVARRPTIRIARVRRRVVSWRTSPPVLDATINPIAALFFRPAPSRSP